MLDVFARITGIAGDLFQLGPTGPLLKRSGEVVELRSSDDSGYATFRSASESPSILDKDLVVKGSGGYRYVSDDLEIADGVTLEVEDGAGVLLI